MTTTSQLLEAWNCEVAKALSSWGDGERLADAVSGMVRALIPVDLTHMTAWDDSGRWLDVHQHPADLELPQLPLPEVFYELDPFYQAYLEGHNGGLSLHETAPAGFEQSAYYQQYYLDYGFSDVLVHVMRLPRGVSIWFELARATGRGRFTRAECELHKAMFPAVEVFSARIADLKWDSGERLSSPDDAGLEGALECFGTDCLTERERAVVRLVLCGHNTQSVASELGIATETAKLHRKHAYAKLRVGSQGELFFQFLQSLESRGPLLRDAPPATSPSKTILA